MPLFVICLLVFAVGIAIVLAGRLLRSYPVVFFGVIFVIGSSVLAIMDGKVMLGIFWLLFSAISTICAGLYFYKNIKGAFWWSLGATVAMIISAIPFEGSTSDPNNDSLLGIILPFVFFFVIGLAGSLIFPRLIHKNKEERKHITNSDRIIGQRVEITKDKQAGRPQRGYIGDVDWQIEPFFPFESFKVGDIVKVKEIKGVTLLCVRDSKDFNQKTKEQRAQDEAERAAKAEEARKAREEKAAARKARREEERAKRLEEKAKREEERAQREAEKAQREAEKRAQEEAAREAKEAEKAEEPVQEEPKVEEPVQEEPVQEEAPIREEQAEPVAKEAKPCRFKEELKGKYALLYVILSAAIVLLCIIVIILAVALKNKVLWLFYVFFALVLAYLIAIFILEVLKAKNKEVEQPVEEPVQEEAPVEEEPKVEEPVQEEPAEEAQPKEKPEFISFTERLSQSDDFAKEAYNELKSEVLSYGIKSRVSSTGDTFRLHKKEYVRMVIAGKFLKLYLALNPEDYNDTTYPFEDASRMGAHKNTPFVFKIKSGLSIRRAKVLIADAAKKDGLEQGEVVPHDHFADLQ